MTSAARRRIRGRTRLVGVGVVVIAACVLALTGCSSGAYAVPTSPNVTADPSAVFDRAAPSIRAVRHGHVVCFFSDRSGGDRLVFPAGYSASSDLLLMDGSGRVVARPGSAVGIAFGSVEVSTPAACGSTGTAPAVVRIEGLGD